MVVLPSNMENGNKNCWKEQPQIIQPLAAQSEDDGKLDRDDGSGDVVAILKAL